MQVKREIGALWADTSAPPYTELFNESLSATGLWRSVLLLRAVDEELQKLKGSKAFSGDLVAIHLNRLILHLVFNDSSLRAFRHDNANEMQCIEAARQATRAIFPRVASYLETHHKDNYLASFSKNLSKCDRLAKVLQGKAAATDTDGQGLLFN